MTTVCVVDDEVITRKGMVEELEGKVGISAVWSCNHDQALALPVEHWLRWDVVIVDAGDRRRLDDQFPGVTVVEAVRAATAARPPLIVVVTGYFADDALRLRMREARADLFFHRSAFADDGSLVRAVLTPRFEGQGVPEPGDPGAVVSLGVSRSSRINAGVDWIRQHGGTPERVFAGVGRRATVTLRGQFNKVTNLDPRNADGGRPDHDRDIPSRNHLDRFYRWATRIKE